MSLRSIAIVASFALMSAASAHAETIKVSLAGKDAATITADIADAAAMVCARAYAGDQRQIADIAKCAADAKAEATSQLSAAKIAAAGAVQIASR